MRFPRRLFGYRPSAVDRRIATLDASITALQDRLEGALEVQKSLQAQVLAQEAEIAAARDQRALIADRLLAADREAEGIRRQALEQARMLIADWHRQIGEAERDYASVRHSVDSLRADFYRLLQSAADLSTARGQEPSGDGSLLDFPFGGRGA